MSFLYPKEIVLFPSMKARGGRKPGSGRKKTCWCGECKKCKNAAYMKQKRKEQKAAKEAA